MVFADLPDRVADIRGRVAEAVARGGHGQEVMIVAVTKNHGPEAVTAAWEAGLRDVGENRVQEAVTKMGQVSVPVRWHLIGHLQRNKIKSLEHFVLFHALDSSRLADMVHRYAMERGSAVDALMQINASGEGTKGGYAVSEVRAEADRLLSLPGIRVRGVMTMARLDADECELRETFAHARAARRVLRDAGHPADELSMGMSGDYEIAVEEGATMIRLGTTLFGPRTP